MRNIYIPLEIIFLIEIDLLPRQARDKQKAETGKESVFSAGVSPGSSRRSRSTPANCSPKASSRLSLTSCVLDTRLLAHTQWFYPCYPFYNEEIEPNMLDQHCRLAVCTDACRSAPCVLFCLF